MNVVPVALLTLLLTADAAVAANFIVNSIIDAPDATPGDGFCASTADNRPCTLRAALQEATLTQPADTVWLPAGVYQLTLPANASVPFGASGCLSASNVTIQGAGREATVIDGGAVDAVLNTWGDVVIANLTVRNGRKISPDPLLYLHGGGIFNSGNLTLREVIVRDNVAGVGAGVGNASQGTLLIEGSTITANTALMDWAAGAGIYNSGTLIVRNSTISNNRIEPNTGGTEDSDGSALSNNSGTFHLTNVTISGNQDGGIWSVSRGANSLSNVTIVGNSTSYSGSAAIVIVRSLEQNVDVTGVHTIRNSIVAGNNGWNCIAQLSSGGYNIDDEGSCNLTADGTSRVVDPGVSTLGAHGGPTFTHALLSDGVAVDAGDPNGCTNHVGAIGTDQRGGPRAVSTSGSTARCDIGAFEFRAPIATAGVRQRVNPGTTVQLNGLLSQVYSSAPSYSWSQVGGDNVTLSVHNFYFATFTAPVTTQPLTFELAVTDNTVTPTTSTARVTVEVNSPPVANAGNNFTVAPSTPVTLNGTGSSDVDGNISYVWAQTAGPSVTLTGATTSGPTFIAPASGPLTFQLTVTDSEGLTHSSTVQANIVMPTPPGGSTGGGGGGGGAIGPLLIATLGLLKAGRRKRRAG